MSRNTCNICGANYEYRKGRWICPACGAFKAEELSNEEATLLYNAAQKLRVQEFDVAEELYFDIINKYPTQHEAYWGYVCSKYGIKYEVDFDGRKIPTCCYTTIESFVDDVDYKKAVKYAPADTAAWYQTQADYIERVRKTWIEKAKNEASYDIFISYKDSDIENGIERTEDSYNALELYNHLARQGYKVFYSRESLRDKIGEKYEPYIYHALQTAKVMIVYSSSVEYVNSTWVKNEWHRFIKQISRGEKKEGSLLIICDGFSPNELPTILSSKQCLDGKSKNLYIDIDEYLKRLYSPKVAEEKAPMEKKKIVVNPLHEHSYNDEIVPASCVARGYTIHRCSCGYEYKDNYTNLAEHKYIHKTVKEATCTEVGYLEEVCSVCGDKKKNTIPAKGHSFGKWIEQSHPSCTIQGKRVRQCLVCGFVEESYIKATGHKWRDIIDDNGNFKQVCELCGEENLEIQGNEYASLKVGDTINFGNYYTNVMKWKVLCVEGGKALILLTKGISFDYEHGLYNTELTWGSSKVRSWLNKEFLEGSFVDKEKIRITKSRVGCEQRETYTEKDKYGVEVKKERCKTANSTMDQIFLLSLSEIRDYNLALEGVADISPKSPTSMGRHTPSGKFCYNNSKDCAWLSRTIVHSGVSRWYAEQSGNSFSSSSKALIRPAMWIDISSEAAIKRRKQIEEENKKREKERLDAIAAEKAKQDAIKAREDAILAQKANLKAEGKSNLIAGLVLLVPSIVMFFLSISYFGNADGDSDGFAGIVFLFLVDIAALIISSVLIGEAALILNEKKQTVSSAAGKLRIAAYIITCVYALGLIIAWLGNAFWLIVLGIIVLVWFVKNK